MSTVSQIKRAFFNSPKFAVVGASKDQTKFGTKILKWYQARNIDITPVHPKETELEGEPAIKTLADLPEPSETSVSVVTPPKVTLGVLEQVKALGIPSVWIQPGAEDEVVIQYIKDNELSDKVVYGGPCVLVEGDGIREGLRKSSL